VTLNPITKTANDIANYVKRQFGDESGAQITDSDIYRWIDAAQLQIVAKSAPIKAKSVTDIVANQQTYDLSALAIHQIESIHYNGGFLPSRSFAEAERYIFDSGTAETGTAQFWYEWAGQISLYPVPDTALVGGLEIFYTKMPTPIANGTTPLSLPDKYFEAIVSWIMAKAYELDEEFDQASNQRQFFDATVNDQNFEERTQQNMTYPVITFLED